MEKNKAEKHKVTAGEVRELVAKSPALPPDAFTSSSLPSMETSEATAFMRRVYDAQVRIKLAEGKKYFVGVPKAELAEVEEGHDLVTVARDDCRWLLTFAREDLQRHLAEDPSLPKITIGIASAYRSPAYDGAKWFDAFRKHYRDSAKTRAAYPGGPHGKEAFRLLLKELTVAKAPGGFSNHSFGRAVDFKTSEVIDGKRWLLSANTSQHREWRKSWFYKWLQIDRNARRYRFVNYPAEEWHYDHDPALVSPDTRPAPEIQHEDVAQGLTGSLPTKFPA